MKRVSLLVDELKIEQVRPQDRVGPLLAEALQRLAERLERHAAELQHLDGVVLEHLRVELDGETDLFGPQGPTLLADLLWARLMEEGR